MNTGRRPVWACAAIALAAHAALLLHAQGRSRHAQAGAPSIAVRHVVEPVAAAAEPAPAPESGEVPGRPEVAVATGPAVASEDASPPDSTAPDFDEAAPPRIAFPDAPMPAEGVQLRAYVELEVDGSPRLVSTASRPGAEAPPPAFQKLAEQGLRQARFKAGLGSAYCLLVRFEPDTRAPTLAWLPGAARDVARCLAGAMPVPRDIDVATSP